MTIEGVGPLTAACLIAELGDPARFRQPRRDRELCWRNSTDPSVRQETLRKGTRDPAGQRPIAKIALDGGSATDPSQCVASTTLRASSRRRKTWQGRGDSSDAEAPDSRLERGDSSPTFRSLHAADGGDTQLSR